MPMAGFSKYLIQGTLTVMGIGCLVIAILTFRSAKGKGCFVAEGNQELLRENQLCHIEELLAKAASQAEALGVTRDKLHEMLDLVAPDTMQ